jgi:hypothetical protein
MALRWPGVRRAVLPHEVAELLGIGGKDRVLAWSPLVGNGYAAATVTALHVLSARGRVVTRPWVEVDHVAWDQDSQTLAVWWVGTRATTALELPESSFLPEVVHERVRASVVTSLEVTAAADGRTLKGHVALRKHPDGTLVVQSVPARPADATTPQLVAAMAAAADQLRRDAGLPSPAGPVAPEWPADV